jgi:hypothetical protein
MEMNMEKNYVIRISKLPSPVQIMIEKILQNVEYFNCLGRRIMNDARCTCEIKSRTSKAKAAFSKKILFTSKMDLNLKTKLVQCYTCSIAL